jgi:DNA polymerase-3 subunit epsilon
MRQIVLDTETTGLEPERGHRIIEIGCVELVDRKLTGRHYHQYINPEREVDTGAIEVHGITNEFLEDKPVFNQVADQFLEFILGAELIIHNAPFDIGFIDHELKKIKTSKRPVSKYCGVIDTLVMARQKHPGQKNTLDALCRRYGVDNSQRELHGALLDAEILADVYLLMTGGQVGLELDASEDEGGGSSASRNTSDNALKRSLKEKFDLKILQASESEIVEHNAKLDQLGNSLWKEIEVDSQGV